MARPNRLADAAEERFWLGVHAAERFFMGEAEVQKALERLVQTLDAHGIPYAILDAMALNEFGYRRVTVDVDVLLTPEGLAAFKETSVGRGYVEKFPGSRSLRDTEHGVDIDVVLAGTYPGDGKPKPVAFPDPDQSAAAGACGSAQSLRAGQVRRAVAGGRGSNRRVTVRPRSDRRSVV